MIFLLYINCSKEVFIKKINLTHTDLDGVISGLVINLATGAAVEYVNYSDIDKRLEDIIADVEVERLIITDISMSYHLGKECHYRFPEKITLLDHHKSAYGLKVYPWAMVETKVDGKLVCGASLALDWAVSQGFVPEQWLIDVVELTRLYDTWEWSFSGTDKPKEFNDLLYIIGRDRFLRDLTSLGLGILDKYSDLICIMKERDNEYVKSKTSAYDIFDLKGFKAAAVFAEKLQNIIATELFKINPEIEIVAVVGSNGVSLRSKNSDVDCSAIASLYNGGGHAQAAGFQFNKSVLLSNIFQV